ncbi:MAG: DUF2490 domain-containing protein [Cytophagales bacterium]
MAQKRVSEQQLVWFTYNNKSNLGKGLELETDIQERFFSSPLSQHQFVFRTMLTTKLEKSWKGSLGICYFLQSPQNPNSKVNNLAVPEIRPHVEFKNKQKFRTLDFNHRYRFEVRFRHKTNSNRTELENGYEFTNYRFRYQIRAVWPFLKKDSNDMLLCLVVADEIMFNMGSKIVNNVFDQNRIYFGLGSQITESNFIEVGYMNWFQQQASGVDFLDRDILRFTLTQKFDFSRKTD